MACCAGVTSENVAARYGISRAQQDEMAARSHKRAAEARASGRFKDEIVPVKTVLKDKEVRCCPCIQPVDMPCMLAALSHQLHEFIMACMLPRSEVVPIKTLLKGCAYLTFTASRLLQGPAILAEGYPHCTL